MGILSWLILGLIAGFIGSKIVNKQGEGLFLNIILGIAGAFVGGFIFHLLGFSGVTGLNIPSMIVAIIGAVIVLVAYHAVTGKKALN
ncbi:MAG: transglycosylase [Acidocella sp. 20-57-95]|nr:MAG: transglycosylase [Acidocella sp. 20-57-95]OYV62438.1 MAG: transglycosylase [Acidocella sp. 21-58-7]HQT64209.1 GlsB/YeaQ/YmgE family stress response membrane protein [Acidocella sp.]HQU03864.1 GlsB/YeaQ/YmgE family stress response membrane protein [Acidocella sp.]